ncbi:MAG: hypothetical protein K8F91_04980 [Candidatus Obscuribacterales bacterium]|nr:hypothetical protein [Candidatus Obscuribacterales bacterium]
MGQKNIESRNFMRRELVELLMSALPARIDIRFEIHVLDMFGTRYGECKSGAEKMLLVRKWKMRTHSPSTSVNIQD